MTHVLETYRQHAPTLGLSTENTKSVGVNQLPEVLKRSLLAFALRFTDHPFFEGRQTSETHSFKQSAMQMLFEAPQQGQSPESFHECIVLLVYADILDSQPASALIRLSMMFGHSWSRAPFNNVLTRPSALAKPVILQADVDVAVLQSIYGASIPQDHVVLVKQQLTTRTSLCCPSPPVRMSQADAAAGMKDVGIWTHVMTMKLSWGGLIGYLNNVKSGTSTESPWRPNSTYNVLMGQIFEFEISCLENHRLNVVDPESRSFDELSQHRDYWNMWFTMQMLYHAYQALLNHPLLTLHHRSQHGRSVQPISFMQHTVDQAILHAGWVCRMIDMWISTGLNISDPFIGYLVGAAATVHFLLCFAKDELVVERATKDFGRCCNLVSTMCLQWKHLGHTKSKLDQLELVRAEHATKQRRANLSKLSSEVLWNLLNYATSSSEATTGNSQIVNPSIDTQLLSPLASHEIQTPTRIDFDPAASVETFDDTLDWETLGFSDEPGILFPVELWTNGQL